MSRAVVRDEAERHGWEHVRVWHDLELRMCDDYFVRGVEVVRVKYDRLGRINGAHKWERGNCHQVTRLGRLTPGKTEQVIGWIHAQPLCGGKIKYFKKGD